MNWESLVVILASSIAVSISTYYLKKGNNKELKKSENGDYVLRLPKIYKYVGVISVAIILVFIIAACFFQDKLWFVMSGIMIALFGGLGIPCLLGFQNYKLEFNDKNITVSNWRRIETRLLWTEIHDIKFNSMSGYIKLYGKNKTLKVNRHLDGLKIFMDKIDENTKWNSNELKIP